MALLTEISLKNFECFKDKVSFSLNDATFFIGKNNSGKSSIFRAICVFFGEIDFNYKFLNKTVFRAKKAKNNVSEITITFDLNEIKLKAFRQRLLKLNKKSAKLTIKAKYTYRQNYTDEVFEVNGRRHKYEDLNPDIQRLIESVKINYIHPQEGAELLAKAQEKLRRRLLDNWGRSANVSQELNKLNTEWETYSKKANSYLSELLTAKVKSFWGNGEVIINLPKKINEIIKVSEINFKMNRDLPAISLTSQGTGVQQSLLYYASYVLDSDRTLRRNKEYHPIWLLEEPESFLHADMIIKLAKDLTSSEWLANLQILLTTHSGLLLASSINQEDNILWNILTTHNLEVSYNPTKIDNSKINRIGQIMGDPNFEIYFFVNKTSIFIEDTSKVLIDKLEEEGIVVKGLWGINEIKKYVQVLRTNNFTKVFFIVDNDKGYDKIKEVLEGISQKSLDFDFSEYELENNVHILLLPKDWAMEELFDGFDSFIDEFVPKIIDMKTKKLLISTPTICTKTVTILNRRYQNKPVNSVDEVKDELRKDDNIKKEFWKQVENNIFKFKKEIISFLKSFLAPNS